MITNFRGKNAQDTEMAEESLINVSFKSRLPDSVKTAPKKTVTYQQQSLEDVEEYNGKRK